MPEISSANMLLGTPQVTIKYIMRPTQPQTEAVLVWGEMKVRSQGIVRARDLDLKTIKVLLLTPVTGKWPLRSDPADTDIPVGVSKYIYNQGEPDNWASVYLWDNCTTEHTGSVWLDFHALGE